MPSNLSIQRPSLYPPPLLNHLAPHTHSLSTPNSLPPAFTPLGEKQKYQANIPFPRCSAGGNLSIALTQLILELNRQPIRVGWHKQAPRAVPLPAGVATNSPWLDMVRISPSLRANAAFAHLPAQNAPARGRRSPWSRWVSAPIARRRCGGGFGCRAASEPWRPRRWRRTTKRWC